MKITTILGSPRKSGNTATVLKGFEQLAAETHEICRINVVDKNINGCRGCWACQKKVDVPGCIQKDDFADTIAGIIASDLVVYASPVYVWDFTAQMKCLIDRHCCLTKYNSPGNHRLMEGKTTMLLTTCSGRESEADLLQEIFKREMNYLGCTIIGMYVVPGCTRPSELSAGALTTARSMIADLEKHMTPRRCV